MPPGGSGHRRWIWGVVGAAGIIAQLQMTKRWEKDIVVAYAERRPGA